MSSWYSLAVNASVVIICSQLKRGQLKRQLFLKIADRPKKQVSLKSRWMSVSMFCRLSESGRKTAVFSFSYTDFLSANTGQIKPPQTCWATIPGSDMNKRFWHFLPNNLRQNDRNMVFSRNVPTAEQAADQAIVEHCKQFRQYSVTKLARKECHF